MHDLSDTVLHLTPDERAPAIPLEGFWDQLMSETFTDPRVAAVAEGGWLVSRFENDGPWGHWECHPNGDEVLVALSGSVTFGLERADGEETLELSEGKMLMVPAGVWHIARAGRGTILAITAGRGTMHRDA